MVACIAIALLVIHLGIVTQQCWALDAAQNRMRALNAEETRIEANLGLNMLNPLARGFVLKNHGDEVFSVAIIDSDLPPLRYSRVANHYVFCASLIVIIMALVGRGMHQALRMTGGVIAGLICLAGIAVLFSQVLRLLGR